MQAVNKAGIINNRPEAIEFLVKYLNHNGLAYVCHNFPFTSAIRLIKDAGGIPVLAHPGLIKDDDIVGELCEMVEGLEVFYYYFGPSREDQVRKYNALAEAKKLLKTGGSDYHGTYTTIVLGETHIPMDEVSSFLKLFGL